MLCGALLRKVDPTLRLRRGQLYTAVNDKGSRGGHYSPRDGGRRSHPMRITDAEDDFWVTQAERDAELRNTPRFSAMIVSPSGCMARMTTISPIAFARFKRWLAAQPTRDPRKDHETPCRRMSRSRSWRSICLSFDLLPGLQGEAFRRDLGNYLSATTTTLLGLNQRCHVGVVGSHCRMPLSQLVAYATRTDTETAGPNRPLCALWASPAHSTSCRSN